MLCVIAFVSLAVSWRSGHSRLSVVTVSRAPVRLCSTETASPWGDVPLDVQQRMHAAGYVRPLPIQRAAMAPIANGSNVVLHAATGSGKTLAYLVPILAKVVPVASGLQAIIVSPSQELAIQIAAEAQRLLPSEQVLLAVSTGQDDDISQRQLSSSSLLVGTPQRLIEVLRESRSALSHLRTVVLDEVDLLQPSGSLDGLEPTITQPATGRGGRASKGRGGRMPPTKGAPRLDGRLGLVRGQGRSSGYGRGGSGVFDPVERRLGQKRPTQVLLEWLIRGRPRSAPQLQVISCSATVSPALRRGLGMLLGGKGKNDAGIVVTAGPAHPTPAYLKRRGVGAVTMPSTLSHTAYMGKEAAKLLMLRVATEEVMPLAPLLVIPNGCSVPKQVAELQKAGFTNAVALPEALGVPLAGAAASNRVCDAVVGEQSVLAGMLQTRLALAERFIARGSQAELPLLVTTEHGARGLDFKNIDCVFLLGLPQRVDSYVHVAGRTAREGRRGRAVSLLFTEEEMMRLDDFRKELGFKVEIVDLNFLKP